jgi:sulfhydrogenase subunit beta (sulfur reductase)
MTTYYLPKADLARAFQQGDGQATFLPVETGGLAWLDSAGAEASLEPICQPRAAQSPKGLFFPSAESVGCYGGGAAEAAIAEARPAVIGGVRACELRALLYLDKVLLEGAFKDPTYSARRESATVVSVDCVDCTDSCFCTSVGGEPFAVAGYDVNLSPVDGGFVVDAPTDKGKQWLGEGGFAEATPEQIAQRDKQREAMTERVRSQNAGFAFTADDETQPKLPDDDDPSWQRYAADCVECGACTNICPTCHCFYLYDQLLSEERFERVRTWDSCLLSSYHRMAGTPSMKPTPRPRLRSRLANRVLHKFSYSPEQYGLLGCVGCGRCVEACLGAIDIRNVVQELSS